MKSLAFKVSPKAEKHIKQGHPWVFDNSIVKQSDKGTPGDLAIIFDNRKNKFLACGLYDPKSPIRIKILSNKPAKIDKSWFSETIKKAYNKRLPLLKTDTNSYRLVYGENDNLPGYIADVYDDVLVIKLYSSIWVPYFEILLETCLKTTNSKTSVLRLSRSLEKELQNSNFQNGKVIYGELKNETIIFKEHGVNFSANVIKGHKTGYFLDHRNNRKKVGEISKNKTVLDVFSYAGGFSVHALVGGAKEVTSLDISAPALEIAKANANLNSYSGIHNTIVGDAFNELEKLAAQNKKYNIVVIDPPSFAKSQKEINGAISSYKKLANLGCKVVKKGGILVLASCSSRILAEEFFELCEIEVARHHRYSILEKTLHDIDHPVSFKEGAYLKCIYFKV